MRGSVVFAPIACMHGGVGQPLLRVQAVATDGTTSTHTWI